MDLKGLIEITSIRECKECGIPHASVRSCEEAELEQEMVNRNKKE